MRSVEQRLERLVCAEHCRYFKPWATPEPDCASMRQVLALVGRRPELLDTVERLRNRRLAPPLTRDAALLRGVCAPCEHYPENCAYRRSDRSPGAVPCGGLLVLDQLLSLGLVSAEELFHSPSRPERRPA